MHVPDLRPDRAVVRAPAWVAVDGVVVAILGFLLWDTFGRSVAWRAEHGPLSASRWVLLSLPVALVLVRRYWPIACLFASTIAIVLADVDMSVSLTLTAVPFLVYVVTIARPPEVSRWLVAAAGLPVALVAVGGEDGFDPAAFPVIAVIYAVSWIVGVRARQSHRRQLDLQAEAAAAIEARDVAAREAVLEERSRIARELHDAVGHAVNVIVMQAGAARLVVHDDKAVEAFRNIERVGRSALGDLDRMLGLLQQQDGPAVPLEPAHRLVDVTALVDRMRAAGADVTLRCAHPRDLEGSVDGPAGAAAYRVVQESLTNVAKHAGKAAVLVSLELTADDLTVCVVDDGRGAAAAPTQSGRGLAGMRERVHVLGGSLHAGARAGGGFEVRARIPARRTP